MDLAWWIAVIGVPLVGALFGVDAAIHARASKGIADIYEKMSAWDREFSNHKVHVAANYVTKVDVKDLEGRFVAAVERIEQKLDRLDERFTNELRRDRSPS